MIEDANHSLRDRLDELDDGFTLAGLRIVESMPRLIGGFLAGQPEVIAPSRALMDEVSADCRAIEDAGFVLLALQAPVGGDLRRLVALLRMCVDVDRSAALLGHVCESLKLTTPDTLPEPLPTLLDELASAAADVFRGGMDAWRTKDPTAVLALDLADEQVDRLQQMVMDTALELDEAAEARLVLGLVARYLERIADHGVAIARDTAFVGTGERVALPSKQR